MSTSLKWRTAAEHFNAGNSLFKEKRYDTAVHELLRAETIFRVVDARGHPWEHTLENGVSGLANTLYLLGRCYEELGQNDRAIMCYETSCVNQKFERRSPFRAFLRDMRTHLASCYERELARIDARGLLGSHPPRPIAIDPSCLFPYSLPRAGMVLCRLYELAPDRYGHFREFYDRTKREDAAYRRSAGKDLDETRMKRATVSIWTIFAILWVIYTMTVARALFLN